MPSRPAKRGCARWNDKISFPMLPSAEAQLEQALAEIELLRQENAELRKRVGLNEEAPPPAPATASLPAELPLETVPTVTNASSVHEKISLFRSLFRGREDVYAVHWRNERTGKKGYAPACEDPWSLRKGQPKKYLPMTEQVVQEHLIGAKTIGVFPLLKDNTCWFLACDFDKEGWIVDALTYLEVCGRRGVPAYLERSRSGNGGHVWTFFSEAVTGVCARQLGMRLLRETMDARADMDLGSYDRFFPNQDFVPKGGFGNLIAAPLQKKCRALGNTEFLDCSTPALRPWPDQWAFLSTVRKLSSGELDALLQAIPPVSVGPGSAAPSPSRETRAKIPAPKEIRGVLGPSISLERSGLPPWMLSQLKHLAGLHNPEFYQREKLRLSTHLVPRFIKCYREDFSHIHLPRGILADVEAVCREAGSRLTLTDARTDPSGVPFEFHGELTAGQGPAVEAILSHDLGVLVAPPGAGKTVMGCFAVAKRGLPTLILAHRKPLLEQWRKQLMTLLGLPSAKIGQVGGGRDRRSGVVDLAMLQSLGRLENLPEFFSRYGFIVVDECHHLPAATFETCLREAGVRRVLGLTATPYRRDGLQDIIAMQCGPVRFRMEEARSNLTLSLHGRPTEFSLPSEVETPIQEVFRALVHDAARNEHIARDVLDALGRGRRCLILSHWKEHCAILADLLAQRGKPPIVLSGAQGKKERVALIKSIQDAPIDRELVIAATGQYLGEGFDCPRLDTLFLAFPIAFKGKLIQYIGRVQRDFPGKTTAEVYDYKDAQVPVLKRMHERRLKVYKALGFISA